LLGSWPADEELWSRFIASKAPAPWMAEEEAESLRRSELAGLTTIPQDAEGLHLWDWHVRGLLKEALHNLRHMWAKTKKKKTGEETTSLPVMRSRVDNYCFVRPRRIYLVRNGKPIKEPDGTFERPLRAETMKGPRVALVASEMVDVPVEIEFEVHLLQQPDLTWDHVETALEYGQYKGLGQWRSGGWGSFRWERIA